jgi:acylphosphatase
LALACQFGANPKPEAAMDHHVPPSPAADPAREQSQSFAVLGDVGAPIFAAWIARHARRLGLRGAILRHDAGRVEMVVTGLPDLLDAMALGCSLGPQEVWVERIDRTETALQNLNEFASIAD